MPDGKRLPAKVLVSDRRSNLVLLKVEAGDLPHLEIAEQPAEVGQDVVAVVVDQGRAVRYVDPHRTRYIAVGIVAATERRVEGISVPLLQTDIRSGVGSAGAPLADENGRLVGIVAAAERSEGDEGSSLAIPARLVTDLLQATPGEDTVVIHPAYLGVRLNSSDDEGGAKVEEVFPDSPAAKTGVKEGDILVAVDGQAVDGPHEATMLIGEQTLGSKTALTLRRDGQERQILVVLGSREQAAAPPSQAQELAIELPRPAQYRVVPLPQAEGANAADAQALTQALAKLLAQQQQQNAEQRGDAEQKAAEARSTLQAHRKALTGQPDENRLTPLTIYVQRTETDRRLDQLTEEVKSLREDMKKLTEQLEAISRNLKE
jgi:hypothetical protein